MSDMKPRPTNTRLARFVSKCIDHLPWVAVRQRREAIVELRKCREAYSSLRDEHFHMKRQIRSMMANVAMPAFRVKNDRFEGEFEQAYHLRTSVHFEPLYVETRRSRRDLGMLSVPMEEIMREHAHALAHNAAKQLAGAIFEQTMRKYGVKR